MSVTCSFPLHVSVTKSCPVIKRVNKVVMLKNNQVPGKKLPTVLQIKSFCKNKVLFEDRSEGVICYRDENGEIICEGYDEGPRFPQQRTFYNLRDAEILDLLQERWLQIVTNGGFSKFDKGVFIVQDDSNWNDFNKFC
ncbi:hypothetical protein COLO4_30860 [Corchorus olitorius]|uniref:Uncharacterized protein n=1 Tax=Corchorus olitorius TaxID=93759 RepID=A0A1R3H6L7_9ROSI|nr:hypothetical protein COLO4_30860 [Corchorus olitorius]